MSRIAVVTGSASGIGRATAELLTGRKQTVIGVDRAEADVCVDLATREGRTEMVERVTELAHGHVDSVFAIAGSALPTPQTVAVNYFGATATLDGLLPLLRRSPNPRAVAVTSLAAIHPADDTLVKALRREDEAAAHGRAAELAADLDRANTIYPSTKRALTQWVRRNAPSAMWAGAGIPLNAVAPGTTATAMTASFLATDEARAALLEITPMPLNGIATPDVVARVLAWLGDADNSHLCGQVIFVDGGSDAIVRGDTGW